MNKKYKLETGDDHHDSLEYALMLWEKERPLEADIFRHMLTCLFDHGSQKKYPHYEDMDESDKIVANAVTLLWYEAIMRVIMGEQDLNDEEVAYLKQWHTKKNKMRIWIEKLSIKRPHEIEILNKLSKTMVEDDTEKSNERLIFSIVKLTEACIHRCLLSDNITSAIH